MSCSHRRLAAICLVALALIVPSTLFGQELPFFDDFEEGLGASWVSSWGGWAPSAGHLFNSNVCGYKECSNPIYNGALDWDDYIVTTEFTPTYGSSFYGNVVYVIICAAEPTRFDATTGYDIDLGWNDEIKMGRSDGDGTGELLVTDSGPEYHLETGTTYIVQFGRIGASLVAKVFEKGAPEPDWQITAVDDTYPSGYFGFATWNTQGWIDNVSVHGQPVATDPSTWGQLKQRFGG